MKKTVLIIAILWGMTLGAFAQIGHRDGVTYAPIALPPHGLLLDQDASIITMLTQTIALAQDYNWFSTYIDISLSDLEDALVAALPGATNIKITAQDGKNRTYNGTTWRGNNFNWDVSQMYIIKCPSACELTLQGLPINPATHPITINPGYNWIGYPLIESVSVTDAFAGFGVANDKITSQSGSNSSYRNGSWKNSFDLVPGQGYIYKSASSETRVFVFPASVGNKK